MNAVTGYVLKKIADAGISRITETLRQRKGKLTTDAEAVESALDYHMRDIKNWCSDISFSDLRAPKTMDKVFVPLDVFLHPLRRRVSTDEAADAVSLESLLVKTLEHGPISSSLPNSSIPPRHLSGASTIP